MFIVALLVLTVVLSSTLAGAARNVSGVAAHEPPSRDSYPAFARDVILGNRFWTYLILAVVLVLFGSTLVAIAVLMGVKAGAILACIAAALLFAARAFFARNGVKRQRPVMKLLQIGGACCATLALVSLLRP